MSDTVTTLQTLKGEKTSEMIIDNPGLFYRETIYETPYSLLDNISPAYREAFGNHLTDQLLKLQKEQEEQENSD